MRRLGAAGARAMNSKPASKKFTAADRSGTGEIEGVLAIAVNIAEESHLIVCR